ncbi:MAG: hypothetical protein ABSG25_12895, partial [Bryobacteraceae bacterium]
MVETVALPRADFCRGGKPFQPCGLPKGSSPLPYGRGSVTGMRRARQQEVLDMSISAAYNAVQSISKTSVGRCCSAIT